MEDVVGEFVAETLEGLETLDSELVRFEQNPDDPQTLGGIFRLIHTIKGTCGFIGLMRLQTVAHSAENVLGAFRDGLLPVTPLAVSAILDTLDRIRVLVDTLAETGAEPPGEDSDLIERLDGLLKGPLPGAPNDAAAKRTDMRPLIERLGGDATLDAAAEAAAARFDPSSHAGDVYHLHAALRDSLIQTARGGSPTDAFRRVAADLFRSGSDRPDLAFDILGQALDDLEIPPDAVSELRTLCLAATGGSHEPLAPSPTEAGEPAGASGSAEPAKLGRSASEAAPASVSPKAAENEAATSANSEPSAANQTIRVSVGALEHLMTVVSELVLIRNQLIQTLRVEPESPFAAPLHRLNQVTSELQEGVMTTRMQPIGGAWAKLPRLVRDLSQDLGKIIELDMSGQDTELDRQVLELIKDPLTHMIRNAADHGLETPDERRAAGKSPTGRINVHARHEGGAIVIEVADDGRGLAADRILAKALAQGLVTPVQAEQMSEADARQLVFLPGFSTASQVTAVSGRGVGMDVVRTNIERIGGAIELWSVEGEGTRVTIRIPLTLTIVSALIVECGGQRFAIPQSAVVELVSASGASGRSIEQINGAPVLRLRDRLLPLIALETSLDLEKSAQTSGETCIVVARVGAFSFGVIVDRVFDIEEIVVKPVATVLRHLKIYSGATILGDGSVILILDPKGMSTEAGAGQASHALLRAEDDPAVATGAAPTALLVFRAANNGLKAAPLSSVSRIEEVSADQIERVDGRTVIQYRGELMPIVGADAEPATPWEGGTRLPLLVFAHQDPPVGLLAEEIVDIVETVVERQLDARGGAASGSLIVAGRAAELIDVVYYRSKAVGSPSPSNAAPAGPHPALSGKPPAKRMLVVDHSPFSQVLLRPLLAQAGYDVTVVMSSEAALALHEAGEQFDLIMADTRPEGPHAKLFAAALARATRWHSTPLLELALGYAGEAAASAGAEPGRSTDQAKTLRGAA